MSSLVSNKRQLIFLWTYTNWGGAQVYFMAIMKVAREDWDVIVCLPNGSKPELIANLEQLGVKLEFIEARFDPESEPSTVGKLRRQYRRIRSEISAFRHLSKFDLSECILHIETGPWQSWQLLVALALRRAKVFATLHNFRPELPTWRKLVWKARLQLVTRLPGFHILASNEDTKKNLQGWVPYDVWRRVPVTYTAVDPEQIAQALQDDHDPISERIRLGIPPDNFVVLTVGQFIDRKGRWVLLDAAAKLRRKDPNITFVWLMPEDIRKADLDRIKAAGVGETFIPLRSGDVGSDRISILRFFRVANIFALPSFVEGLPIALLEAMAMGLPSISTNVYAIPEAIQPNVTGLLIEPGDSAELASSILRLKSDPDVYARLSAAGRERVLQRFDERIAAMTCVEAYDHCFR